MLRVSFAGGRPAVVTGAFIGLALLASEPVFAQTPAPRTDIEWLQAIQAAAQRQNYRGTIVYQRGGAMQTSRVVHYFDGNVSHERLQVLDGKRREYVRRDAEVQCLYPDSKRVRLERRPEQERFPAIGAGTPNEILERYRLVERGVERVANTDCRVLVLEPKDDLRYGLWLCAEARTALLLKAVTLDERAQALDQMAFADLRIGERLDRSQLKPSWSTEGWTIERSEPQPADFEGSGWQISAPEGFRLQSAVKRSMAATPGGAPAMQVVYGDGLATLSVFIEAGAGNAPASDDAYTQGPISAYARRIGDALVTVIGEVPPKTVRQLAMSVTRSGTAAPPR
jgi:sigma-E factor negative regulatory protein RseB